MSKKLQNENIGTDNVSNLYSLEGDVLTKAFNVSSTDASWPRGNDGKPLQVRGQVAIDFTGCDLAQIMNFAARTMIIKLQNQLRTNGYPFVKDFLAKGTIQRNAMEFGLGVESTDKAINKVMEKTEELSPEQLKMLIDKMQAEMARRTEK